MPTAAPVRSARTAELPRLVDVYERANFNPSLAAVARFARDALGGEVFVAERDGGPVGASACAHFGATACRRTSGGASARPRS